MQPLDLAELLLGLVGLVLGAELLVRGASRLATRLGVRALVVGLTVVAFGTSAPELAVTLRSGFRGAHDIALGSVVGSNIANVLLILGASALAAPLVVAQKLVRLDVPLMIALSALVWLFALDGGLGRVDGALLAGGWLVHVAWTVVKGRREPGEVREEYERELAELGRAKPSPSRELLLVLAGLGLLAAGADWLVDGALACARWLGASELVIGLTVVAVGTSLPELATSVVASLRGERDIAVGNAIGGNVFNLLAVLGLTALLVPGGIPVASGAIAFDLPVMFAVAFGCLPIFVAGHRISRPEGLLFLLYYGCYLTWLVLDAGEHPLQPVYARMVVWFVFPMTGITLAVLFWRHLRAAPEGQAS
jgi:cation:H+ antiporter